MHYHRNGSVTVVIVKPCKNIKKYNKQENIHSPYRLHLMFSALSTQKNESLKKNQNMQILSKDK